MLDLHPQSGREMAKRRPCLVLSNKAINKKLKRVIICPITSTPPKIKTHVPLPVSVKKAKGTVIVDQLKSMDYISRNATKIDVLINTKVYQQIVDIVGLLIRE